MPEKKQQQRQKRAMFAVLILCLVFLVCSLSFVFYMMMENEAEKMEYLNNAARQNQMTIRKQINGDFQTLEGISVCLGITDMSNTVQVKRVLQKINDSNDFIRMGFADVKGNLELLDIGGKRQTQFNMADQAFFKKALAGEEAISPTLSDSLAPGQYINYYAVPVKDANDTIIGVLCAVNSSQTLREIIDAPLLNGAGYSNIIDQEGNFVIRSKFASSSEDIRNIDGLGTIEPEKRAAVAQALKDQKSVQYHFSKDGTTYQAVVEPIGINGWLVVSLIPETVLVQRYGQTAVGTTIIILVACSIFTALFYQQRRMSAKSQAALLHLAYDDPLTKHRNFSKFLLDAKPVVESAGEQKLAIWYCDLKRFKYYNDIFGYRKGDQVLRWFAEMFQRCSGPDALFCRVSADNFAGIRAFNDHSELVDWYEKILSLLRTEKPDAGSHLNLELCMGFYCIEAGDAGLSVNDMVNRANMAQKSVKHLPGSQYAFYTQELREQSLWETELETRGKQALINGEFVLYLQPKVNIQNGNRIAGAEALARWQHPEKGLVAPGRFIPQFESNGMIVQLDRYMFEQVCRWYHGYLSEGRPRLSIAINVSRLGLLRDDFVEFYSSVKQKHQIPDGTLELEFTESILLDDDDMFLSTVYQLQENGFICSLDDFGSGYSSLNVLKNLPINVLKLDIMFFRNSVDVERERIIISNIINMAKQLKIKSIAEGVEAVETVAFLRDAGCSIVQGYVFAKPMPLATFDELMHSKGSDPFFPHA